jgi:hypothetical protein
MQTATASRTNNYEVTRRIDLRRQRRLRVPTRFLERLVPQQPNQQTAGSGAHL